MELENILQRRSTKCLFDQASNEYGSITKENRQILLASLNFWQLLDEVIENYRQDHEQKPYVQVKLKPNLDRLISELRYGKNLTIKGLSELNLKRTVEVIKDELVKKINPKYSLDQLVIGYLKADKDLFTEQNKFFRIDFEKDLTDELANRDASEGRSRVDSYVHLYRFLFDRLIPDFRKGEFGAYRIEMGMDYQTEYVVKHFIQEASKENFLRAIIYAVEILYLNKPPFHEFHLIRMNFPDANTVKRFKERSQVAIQFNTEQDFEDWKAIVNDGKSSQQYTQRWQTLCKTVKEKDVIVCASYKEQGYLMGTIQRGASFEKTGDSDVFHLAFQLKNVKSIDLDQAPFVQTILPANVTLSRVLRMNTKLRKVYHDMMVRLPSPEFDDIGLEILVAEWLRSNHAPKEYKLKFQLLKTGGNKKHIDVYGITAANRKLIAQVSDTRDNKLIDKKINMLGDYPTEDFIKLFFFWTAAKKTHDYEIINLDRVVSDLSNDGDYLQLIEELR